MPRTLKLALLVFSLLSLCAPAALARQEAPDPQLERGVALYRKGDAAGAVKEFRAAVKRRQDDPRAWTYLGQALIQSGDLKEARKALDAALKLNPDYALARSYLAFLLLSSGNEREAEAEVAKALALDNNLNDAHYVLVLRRLSHGLTEKAIEATRQVRFKPATLNGQPVSQYVILEYGFNLNERFIRTGRPAGW